MSKKIFTNFQVDMSKFDEWTEDIQYMVGGEIEAFGMNVADEARQNVPIDNHFLQNSIVNAYTENDGKPKTEITVGAPYAAYVEFGTGQFAADYVTGLPAELQEYAMQFFVSGKGRLPARPFLFPAYFKHLEILKKNIELIAESMKG